MVNAAATLSVVVEPVSYMSGRAQDVLTDLVFDTPEGLLVVLLLASFCWGSFWAGKLLSRRGAKLLLDSALMLVATSAVVLAWGGVRDANAYDFFRYAVAFLLATAGGLQNGASTLLIIGRTTHVTGDITDLGLAISSGQRRRAAFLLYKLVLFATGGLLAYLGMRHVSFAAMLLVSAAVLVVGFVGLQKLTQPAAQTAAQPASAPRLERST